MADVFDKTTRSAVMSKVRSKNNQSTELKLLRLFRDNDVTGWKRSYPVKGNPDFVFLKKRVAVFTDGCFWHGHDCRNTRPKDNAEYWRRKRERNMERDRKITELFKSRGWIVLRIWECELKKKKLARTLKKILDIISPE
jgi:DNA mismatch endonuclease (patch repair protein)